MKDPNQSPGPASPETPSGAPAAPDKAPDAPAPVAASAADKLQAWPEPRPRRRQDRQAGPSEKQVYVPPVSLPPNKEPTDLGMEKIRVDPALLVRTDERSRPTIRRLPNPLLMEPLPDGAQAAHARAAAAGAAVATPQPAVATPQPPAATPQPAAAAAAAAAAEPPAPRQPSVRGGMPVRTIRMNQPGAAGASPWGANAPDAAIDKSALPSSQLAKPPPESTPKPARPAERSMGARIAALVLIGGAAAAAVFYFTRAPKEPREPVRPEAAQAPPTGPAAPLGTAPPPGDTAPAAAAAAPADTAPKPSDTAPPADTTSQVSTQPAPETRPPPQPVRKPPKPRPSATEPKPSATAAPEAPPPEPTGPPVPPSSTAPPRPF